MLTSRIVPGEEDGQPDMVSFEILSAADACSTAEAFRPPADVDAPSPRRERKRAM
jgi:hypothetical protein